MVRKSVRITKVNLSDLIRQQHGQVEELESAYAALQGSLTISTEKDRAAAEAEASASMIRAQANMAAAQGQSSFLAFLRLGSAYSTLVATERNWLPPFRNSDGDICIDRKSTRLNSSHLVISYAVFCLKKEERELERRPRVSGTGAAAGHIYLNARRHERCGGAEDEAKRLHDEYVSVEHLFFFFIEGGPASPSPLPLPRSLPT